MKPDICDWLRDYLKDGAVDVSQVRRAARDAGYTRGELREAKRICCIQTANNWSRGHRADRWFWSLPEDEG